jgi:DNA-binding Lrp family transcriptional regulator
MSISFILINVASGHEIEVYNILSKVNGITELHPLFGEYDLIAKIKADDFDKVGDIVLSKIRSIKGVINTKTLTSTKF